MAFSIFTFRSMRKIKAQSFLYPKLQGYEVMALPDICRVWKVRAAKPIENKPVKSDFPTLVVTGEYDAYTPPVWGAAVAKNLKNSFLFEVPWTGHGPAFSVPCLADMITEFIDDPKTAPNAECLTQLEKRYKFTIK